MRFLDNQVEAIEIERLANEVTGPEFHRFHGNIDITMAGDHDHLDVGNGFANLDQQFQIRNIGQPQVHDDDIKPVAAHHGQGLSPIGGGEDFPPVAG